MNYITYLFAFIILISCNPSSENEPKATKIYPDEITAILDHHGGLSQWKKMKTMSFEIVRKDGNEKQYIDVTTRKERIEGSNYSTGFDGEQVWLLADSTYHGNAKFYHNLMFYFYAMPFVLADDGLVFSQTEPLVMEGDTFPGLRVSFDSDIGFSPEDEYFVHYEAKTNRMAWLGYTVTYYSQEKSKDVHWIKYDDWGTHNDLVLSNSLSWYQYENALPTVFRKKQELTN